jgi:hypothetical protein
VSIESVVVKMNPEEMEEKRKEKRGCNEGSNL